MTSIIYSEKFLLHETGYMHPEQPERLTAVVNKLKASKIKDKIKWIEPSSRNAIEAIKIIHSTDYINLVRAYSDRGYGCFESTQIFPHSFEVACLAVNAWLDGVDIVSVQGKPAFILARPPGHHALLNEGMGFCIFCNPGIAAIYALTTANINRVGILDWDVHHGNGTQAVVENNSNIAFCSIHQSPGYPHTGKFEETGKFHNILNLPIPPGSNIQTYHELFENKVLPFFDKFSPDLLIVSAGYDANKDDLMSKIELNPEDYGILAQYSLQITQKVLFGLEGGYELESLAQSVLETLNICVK